MKISVIITTYNRPKALSIALDSLMQQTQLPHEVIVADDGSDSTTKELLDSIYFDFFPIKHIWQEDNGFQAAAIRNRATAQATGDYLIYLDGDIAVLPHFIERHLALAEPNWFVAGNRILLNQQITQLWESNRLSLFKWNRFDWLKARINGSVNRLLPFINISAKKAWRKKKKTDWKGAKTCNLAVWKKDLLAINGFDEAYQGWGHEDADLAIRLIHTGIYRKDGRFSVPALHLWHKENSRHNEKENWQRLQDRIADKDYTWAEKGLDQYL